MNLKLAHQLQFSMLPREVPAASPMSIAAVLESYCHLSGDLFGWELLEDGRFLLWIVDLSGHGVRAGLACAVLKVLVDNLRQRNRVDSLAVELNDAFIGCLRNDKTSLFATGFFMTVSDDGLARFTSAGHPPVLLRKNDGQVEKLSSTGLPIGIFGGRRYVASEFRLEPRDMLLLYTDGLTEATDKHGAEFGLDRVHRLLCSGSETPRELTHRIYQEIASHQDMAKLDDDITFVVARMGRDESA